MRLRRWGKDEWVEERVHRETFAEERRGTEPPEAHLSAELGVSRTVVREASKVLAAPAGACESMEALIASTARGAGGVVEGRPAIGRNT